MNTKKLDVRTLSDGTTLVQTPDTDPWFKEARVAEDAALQEALERYRSGGISKPVLMMLNSTDPNTLQIWRKLEPEMNRLGIRTRSTVADWNYVLKPTDARKLLEPLIGKVVRAAFREPNWPRSWWTVVFTDYSCLHFAESRAIKDIPPELMKEDDK